MLVNYEKSRLTIRMTTRNSLCERALGSSDLNGCPGSYKSLTGEQYNRIQRVEVSEPIGCNAAAIEANQTTDEVAHEKNCLFSLEKWIENDKPVSGTAEQERGRRRSVERGLREVLNQYRPRVVNWERNP